MTHAAESTHWYTRDGLPMYDILGTNGKMRPTTLRDARKLGLVPSVTGIIKCAAAPGLTNWMIDQAILSALTLPVVVGESSESYLSRIKQDSKEQARKAAEKGTAIHAAVQGAYEDKYSTDMDMLAHIGGAMKEVEKWAPGLEWIAEAPFAHPLGFGGKTDLHARMTQRRLLDFKSKEFGPDDDLKTWDEQAMQLAANREGQGIPDAPCAICYVSVTNPGLSRLIEIPEEELSRGWEMFVFLLSFWKAKNRFRSGFAEEKKAA